MSFQTKPTKSAVSAKPKNASTPTLSVLSYNVNFAAARYGGGKKTVTEQNVLDAISNANCDVVLLQETHAGWEDLFAREDMHSVYPYHLFHDETFDSSGGLSVFSKFPFDRETIVQVCVCSTRPLLIASQTPSYVNGSWFPAFHGVFYALQSEFHIASVHLRPPVYEAGKATPMTMTNTSGIRLNELKLLLASMAQGEENIDQFVQSNNVIIAGDFNENSNHSACSWLHNSLGMHDSVSLYHYNTHWWPLAKVPFTSNSLSLFSETFSPALRSIAFLALKNRLDHVFHSPSTVALSCDVMAEFEGNASDHLPIATHFRLASDEKEKKRLIDRSFQNAYTSVRVGLVQVDMRSIWGR